MSPPPSFRSRLALALTDADATSPSLLRKGAFSDLFKTVPSSVRNLVGESSLRGVLLSSKTRRSSHLWILEDIEDVCCGAVGSAGFKMCIRPKGTCPVIKHLQVRSEGVTPGVFLKMLKEDDLETLFATPI